MKTEKLFRTPLNDVRQKNSELNHLECQAGKAVSKSYPRRVVFELTNRCNYRCIMCGREAADFKTYELPLHTIKQLEDCYPHVEEVTLHGWGEGTLHSSFLEVLEYLNKYPYLRKYFVTNGSTLDKVRPGIFDYHVDLVAISLDGATAITNDNIRKGASFRKIIASLKRLVKEKKDLGLDYPYINFCFTAMRQNIHELPELITLAHDIGIPEVKVVYLTVFKENLLSESLMDKQNLVSRAFYEARNLADKFNINLKLPAIQGEDDGNGFRHKPCALPWRDLYIGSDGFIRPCQSSSSKLGHVSEYESFDMLWNSKQMQGFRHRVNDEWLMPKSCYNCYHSSCANWNLSHSYVQLNQHFAPTWSVEKYPLRQLDGTF
jgi:radical SAM protein with 4Fe4S-binding SPASM domain